MSDWREDALTYKKNSITPNMRALMLMVFVVIVAGIALAHVGTLLLSYMDIYADL